MAARKKIDVKRIMVVDDHFEMLEFLRSMLELAERDYEVLAVPSAEECMLELRRSHFDLLITDVRLPGMSGFDLVRRMRKLGQDMPVIMITAYSSSQGKKEAEELGVYRYFRKPLDTDEVLTAVNQILYGAEETPPAQPATSATPLAAPQPVRDRLETLRNDTGAVSLTLATAQGQVVLALGHAQQQRDPDSLMQLLTQNMINSFHLADQIGNRKPYTFQYHRGRDVDLYCASVGRKHYLTMFFNARSRRGRIGTIWVFTQRAIKDLLTLLPEGEQVKTAPAAVVSPPDDTPSEQPAAAVATTPPPSQEDRVSPTAIKERPPRAAGPKAKPKPEPKPEPEPEPDHLDIDPAELEALLGSAADLDTDELPDLDEFWDNALEEAGGDSSALSFEEAMQRGLISLDIDEEE